MLWNVEIFNPETLEHLATIENVYSQKEIAYYVNLVFEDVGLPYKITHQDIKYLNSPKVLQDRPRVREMRDWLILSKSYLTKSYVPRKLKTEDPLKEMNDQILLAS
jgi:hypothetical protein